MKHPCGKVFDIDKTVKLQNGRKARIICKDRKNNDGHSILVLEEDMRQELSAFYYPCGHICNDHSDCEYDLVNIEENKMSEYVGTCTSCGKNFYDEKSFIIHNTHIVCQGEVKINWDKPIYVLNEVSGVKYKANVSGVCEEVAGVIVYFPRIDTTYLTSQHFIFSKDGKKSNFPKNKYWRFVVKNVEEQIKQPDIEGWKILLKSATEKAEEYFEKIGMIKSKLKTISDNMPLKGNFESKLAIDNILRELDK